MLYGSMKQPLKSVVGDYWYSYAERHTYARITLPLIGSPWMPLAVGAYTWSAPPVGPGMPPIWIDSNDLNSIPHIYDPASGGWIPVVSNTFSLPPVTPNPGDIWHDTNTLVDYMYDATILDWIQVGGSSLQILAVPPMGSSASGNPFRLSNTPAPQPLMTIPSGRNSCLKIHGLVEIFSDGTIVYELNYTPDRAAQAMWQAIAAFSPQYKEGEEVKKLRYENDLLTIKSILMKEQIEYATARGFKFLKFEKPIDPIDAWDAAMGIIP